MSTNITNTNLTNTNLLSTNNTLTNIVSTNITNTSLRSTNNTLTNIVSTSITSGNINVPWFSNPTEIHTSSLTTITSATAVTISASQMLSGSIIRIGQGNNVTDYFDSPTNLIDQINIVTNTQASAGMSFYIRIYNLDSHRFNFNSINGTFGNPAGDKHIDSNYIKHIMFMIITLSPASYVYYAFF